MSVYLWMSKIPTVWLHFVCVKCEKFAENKIAIILFVIITII